METSLIVVAAVLWGCAAGVLLPRAVYRLAVPSGEAWRETCPAAHPFTGPGNGWIGRARCADGTSYGPSTPVLAGVTALVCVVLAAAVGARPELGVWQLLAPVGVLLAAVDLAVHRLPDAVTLPFAALALVLLGVAEALPATGGQWRNALTGSLALGVAFFVLFLISPKGIGFGDVKLALGLGAVLGWYGWGVLFGGTFLGFLYAALYGTGLLLTRRAGRGTTIPFGPFLIAGAFSGVILGSGS